MSNITIWTEMLFCGWWKWMILKICLYVCINELVCMYVFITIIEPAEELQFWMDFSFYDIFNSINLFFFLFKLKIRNIFTYTLKDVLDIVSVSIYLRIPVDVRRPPPPPRRQYSLPVPQWMFPWRTDVITVVNTYLCNTIIIIIHSPITMTTTDISTTMMTITAHWG